MRINITVKNMKDESKVITSFQTNEWHEANSMFYEIIENLRVRNSKCCNREGIDELFKEGLIDFHLESLEEYRQIKGQLEFSIDRVNANIETMVKRITRLAGF